MPRGVDADDLASKNTKSFRQRLMAPLYFDSAEFRRRRRRRAGGAADAARGNFTIAIAELLADTAKIPGAHISTFITAFSAMAWHESIHED